MKTPKFAEGTEIPYYAQQKILEKEQERKQKRHSKILKVLGIICGAILTLVLAVVAQYLINKLGL